VSRYQEFLAERRKLLAAAANDFLKKLVAGSVPDPIPNLDSTDVLGKVTAHVPGGIGDDDEEERLERLNRWAVKRGLPEGMLSHELTDVRGRQLAVLDLAWPDGVQPGLTQPVCVLIDEDDEVEDAASLAGYRCFSSPHAFRKYVRDEILHEAENDGNEIDDTTSE
jgi:hypothetical protein